MPKPIPLSTNSAGGTGFLVSRDATTWLVTSVHLLSELINTPPTSEMDVLIKTLIIPETNIAIPVATPFNVDGKRRPNVVTCQPINLLADVISIVLTKAEADLLTNYGSYDLNDLVAPKVGDEVRITGFPGLGDRLSQLAAVGSPQTTITEVKEVVGASAVLPNSLQEGYSGSAVTIRGKLCGVMQGSPANRLSEGMFESLMTYKSVLFQ